ncbi:arsenite efflux MFS transporter ArsK [Rhizobium sp. KVB221]|uniref:Arsenite efflux MFS transporter ArsK n=1 Tax=Rhizobium setariae TaxID=2801340 RepID=A0A936YQ09_9HYPH|nr:arsenite efflux MFS transporter ArsK [Rhizobium setariae]MBL0372371.1 arsenite efflux MFS transporter ArsK [Rhizobium setariae]
MRQHYERVPVAIVVALGLTQIIGYGTLYYSFSILAPDMAKDLGWSVDQVFGIFSGSLLVGGVIAPLLGRYMDKFGAGRLMTIGSMVAAFTLLLCAYSNSALAFVAAIVLLEIASGMVQYQAAFAALVETRPHAAGKSITYLTLIAGFASTLFWPITSALHLHLSWREIYLIYAILNLIICVPIHFWIMRSRSRSNLGSTVEEPPVRHLQGALPMAGRRSAFFVASGAFALQGFALSAMLVHMVPMLTGLGLGGAAVVVSAIFGPSQVLSRFINMIFGSNLSPPLLSILSASFIVSGIVVLVASGGWLVGAVAFAILLGLGSGLNSIVQGSLPLWLFGSEGYGALTGKMAAIRLVAGAAAPFTFAAFTENLGISISLTLTALLGGVGLVGFEAVRRLAGRSVAA